MVRQKTTQTEEQPPLVAIDLGSSSIRAMAAQRIAPDMLRILGVEKNTKKACIDRGAVVQSTNAGYMISEALRLLANRIGVDRLQQAFVLTGGRSMQTVSVMSKRDLVREHEITQALLNELKDECKNNIERCNPQVAVMDLLPTYYVLDKKEQDEMPLPPQRATLIEVHYTAFVCRKEYLQKVHDSFDRAGKDEEACFVRPDALLSALSAEDSDFLTQGCAVLDLGAQTTTLCIYKGCQYLATKVVPLGSWHITRLIEQEGIDIRYAETMKCKYGCAMPELVETDLTMNVPSVLNPGEKIKITTKELADTIQSKLDEIMAPLTEVLAPFEERIKTLFITGGGSKLNGMVEYIRSKTSLEVMYGSHACLLAPDTPDEYYSPEYSALIGALILGSDYREMHKDEDAPPRSKNFWEKVKNKFENQTMLLFTDQK